MRDPLAERNRTIDNYWAKIQAQAAVITQMEARIIKMQADDRELIAENVALRKLLADVYSTTYRSGFHRTPEFFAAFSQEPVDKLRTRFVKLLLQGRPDVYKS